MNQNKHCAYQSYRRLTLKLFLCSTKQRGRNRYLRGSDAAPVVAVAPTSGLGTAGLGAWCVAGELVTDAEVSEPADVPPAIGFDTPADNSPRSEAIKNRSN